MKFAILIALVVTAVAEPVSRFDRLSATDRIVGGKPTTIEEVPFQVSLRVFESHMCGGSIISNQWILTAAHCLIYPTEWCTIRSGSTFTDSEGYITGISSGIRHPKYGSNNWGVPVNDIAIISLSSALTFGSTQAPVSLYSLGEIVVPGTPAEATGWGVLKEGGSVSRVLQTVTVFIVSKSECSAAYASWGGLPHGQICTAVPEGGKDPCQGDSGGPLTVNGTLVGIVSWGYGCARPNYPGVYTEVAHFRDWITTNSGI